MQPGKIADLVMLEADPLKDIANLHRINEVMRPLQQSAREGALPTPIPAPISAP